MKKNLKVVHSLALAMDLVRRGFDIKKVEDSFANKKFKVFLFEDTIPLKTELSLIQVQNDRKIKLKQLKKLKEI